MLVTGQQQIAGGGQPPEPQDEAILPVGRRLFDGLARAAGLSAMVIVLLVSTLAGLGLLYGLRALGPVGPRIGDALPLLALAHNDGQSLLLVAIAFLAAGAVFGYAMRRGDPVRRGLAALAPVLLVLLLASDASYALAHNLRLTGVLSDRSPGLGPWVEGLLFAAGAAISAVRLGAAAAWAQATRGQPTLGAGAVRGHERREDLEQPAAVEEVTALGVDMRRDPRDLGRQRKRVRERDQAVRPPVPDVHRAADVGGLKPPVGPGEARMREPARVERLRARGAILTDPRGCSSVG